MYSFEGNVVDAPVASLSNRAAHPPMAPHELFVTLRLNELLFALPLKHVERALRMAAVTPVPNAPLGVFGILNLSGRLVPALDLRDCLGLPAYAPGASDRLLILTIEDQTLAIFAEEVCEVTALNSEQATAPAAFPSLSHSEFILVTLHHDDGVIFVLDPFQVAALLNRSRVLR